MSPDVFLWVLARVSGLSSFVALSLSLVTGLALRSAVLDWLASNRAVRSTHEFTTVLWIPLGVLHLASLLLDGNVRPAIRLVDLVIPFQVPYSSGYGTLAIGLGTLTAEIFVVVAVTGWLRRRMRTWAWRWIHRLSYLAYGMLFLHALLAGSDFSTPIISAIAWSSAAALGVLALSRIVWGRLPA